MSHVSQFSLTEQWLYSGTHVLKGVGDGGYVLTKLKHLYMHVPILSHVAHTGVQAIHRFVQLQCMYT